MTAQAPTYEEVVAYCVDNGFIGKVDTVKFYDWYDKQNWMFKGLIMDWKKKLPEWAARSNGRITQSAKEYNAISRLPNRRKFYMPGKVTTDLKEYLAFLKEETNSWRPQEGA